jgi:hypothetical protein
MQTPLKQQLSQTVQTSQTTRILKKETQAFILAEDCTIDDDTPCVTTVFNHEQLSFGVIIRNEAQPTLILLNGINSTLRGLELDGSINIRDDCNSIFNYTILGGFLGGLGFCLTERQFRTLIPEDILKMYYLATLKYPELSELRTKFEAPSIERLVNKWRMQYPDDLYFGLGKKGITMGTPNFVKKGHVKEPEVLSTEIELMQTELSSSENSERLTFINLCKKESHLDITKDENGIVKICGITVFFRYKTGPTVLLNGKPLKSTFILNRLRRLEPKIEELRENLGLPADATVNNLIDILKELPKISKIAKLEQEKADEPIVLLTARAML